MSKIVGILRLVIPCWKHTQAWPYVIYSLKDLACLYMCSEHSSYFMKIWLNATSLSIATMNSLGITQK